MIVEDDERLRELYSTILSQSQYNVQTAVSASELYDKLQNFKPDVMLLDLMLPGTSGIEILKELRKNPAHNCQQTKIMLLTNMSESTFKDEAIKEGADGYLIKADIELNELPGIISEI